MKFEFVVDWLNWGFGLWLCFRKDEFELGIDAGPLMFVWSQGQGLLEKPEAKVAGE